MRPARALKTSQRPDTSAVFGVAMRLGSAGDAVDDTPDGQILLVVRCVGELNDLPGIGFATPELLVEPSDHVRMFVGAGRNERGLLGPLENVVLGGCDS